MVRATCCVTPRTSDYTQTLGAMGKMEDDLASVTTWVWKAAASKADPRQQQGWVLMCQQGGRARPLTVLCGGDTLLPVLETKTLEANTRGTHVPKGGSLEVPFSDFTRPSVMSCQPSESRRYALTWVNAVRREGCTSMQSTTYHSRTHSSTLCTPGVDLARHLEVPPTTGSLITRAPSASHPPSLSSPRETSKVSNMPAPSTDDKLNAPLRRRWAGHGTAHMLESPTAPKAVELQAVDVPGATPSGGAWWANSSWFNNAPIAVQGSEAHVRTPFGCTEGAVTAELNITDSAKGACLLHSLSRGSAASPPRWGPSTWPSSRRIRFGR
jgi:hypothetical protein